MGRWICTDAWHISESKRPCDDQLSLVRQRQTFFICHRFLLDGTPTKEQCVINEYSVIAWIEISDGSSMLQQWFFDNDINDVNFVGDVVLEKAVRKFNIILFQATIRTRNLRWVMYKFFVTVAFIHFKKSRLRGDVKNQVFLNYDRLGESKKSDFCNRQLRNYSVINVGFTDKDRIKYEKSFIDLEYRKV